MKAYPFIDLAEVLEKAKGTTSKIEKVDALSGYLKGLSPDAAQVATRIASGRSSARGSADEAQVGYSTVLEVLKEVTGAGGDRVSKVYLKHGDLGEVAEELLAEKKEQPLFEEPLTLADLSEAFQRLRSAKGQGSAASRKGLVKSLLLRASPLEGKYIVKVLTGEMRTGLVSGLVEEAIAKAFDVPRAEAARAHMVVGDLGELARAAASGSLDRLRMEIFRPVNFMLAEPMADASEVAGHFSGEAYAECKYDGVRAQVHKKGKEVRIFSRRLEDITASFPEVASAALEAKGDFVLDGEIVPFKDGGPLPFQLLQRRLRRMENFEEAARNAPVEYFAFDILLRDRKELVELPLSDRRKLLASVVKGTTMRTAESETVEGEAGVARAFRRSRDRGYEGLVVKDPESPYVMGKRGSGWVKLKEELDTLDVVIVAAEYGHGKRAGVISDYTFAVRDGSSLRTIGKAYSGLSDKEIDEMTARLKASTVKDYGYRRDVKPEIVLEVAFDSIQRSDRHDSGFALRFPRIKRIRDDKASTDIDTLDRVKEIFSGQTVKLEDGPSPA